MRSLFVLALLASVVWWASRPIYYFIMGPEIGKLPPYQRITTPSTAVDCYALMKDWNSAFPTSGGYCEEAPRWTYWMNSALNIADQIAAYRSHKVTSVE
jgi:hypothetical protein